MQACTLYLVRHGESVANRDGLVGGHFDSPLTELGRAQAEAVKKELAGVHFDTVYSSDLRRAAETAELIYGHPVPREHRLSELRERNFGRLEGQPVEEWFVLNKEYERRFGSLPFAERMLRRAADFIESDGQVLSRVVKAFNQIAEQHQGQTVLVANHGGPIRVTLMHLGYADLLTAGSFQNGGYVVLIGDGHSLRIEKVVGVTKALNAE